MTRVLTTDIEAFRRYMADHSREYVRTLLDWFNERHGTATPHEKDCIRAGREKIWRHIRAKEDVHVRRFLRAFVGHPQFDKRQALRDPQLAAFQPDTIAAASLTICETYGPYASRYMLNYSKIITQGLLQIPACSIDGSCPCRQALDARANAAAHLVDGHVCTSALDQLRWPYVQGPQPITPIRPLTALELVSVNNGRHSAWERTTCCFRAI